MKALIIGNKSSKRTKTMISWFEKLGYEIEYQKPLEEPKLYGHSYGLISFNEVGEIK